MNKIKLNSHYRVILNDTLVQYFIYDFNSPLMITFSPAGKTLSEKEVGEGKNSWGFDFFHNKRFNVISFNAITNKHWFLCDSINEFILDLDGLLDVFPCRLGYGASMGAFAVNHYASLLKIDRMLLFTPRSPSEDIQIQNLTHSKDSVWVFVDPFHRSDKKFVDDNFKECRLFFFYGVGHRVIESLSSLKILPVIIKDFVEEKDISNWYYSAIRKRRKISRYYSYMLRVLKKRKSKSFISSYRLAYIIMILSNPRITALDLLFKWNKSMRRLYKSIVKGGV